MPTPIVVRYPLDPTGLSPDNKVLSEEHTLSDRPIKAFATSYGGFFTESVVVREKDSQRVLDKDVDYYCAELYDIPTARYGKEICAIIVITDSSVASDITVDYQALGGPWCSSQDAIIQMIDSLNLDDRPVKWGDIIGKPAEFNPAPHLTDAGDIYGFEYVVAALERVKQAILVGDDAAHDEIYKYVDTAIADLSTTVDTTYVKYNQDVEGSIRVISGIAQVYANSAWQQFWPPLWQ